MTRGMPKYIYEDKRGEWVHKRQNMTKQKVAVLKALCQLDKEDARATAYDSKMQERYYDIKVIARRMYGDGVFEDGILKVNTRSSLNQMLEGLRTDGFITMTGGSEWGRDNMGLREYWRYHHRLTAEGKRCLSSAVSGFISQWMRNNRYIGINGVLAASQVIRLTNTTHPEPV